jgi:predicted MFS family arabinose efflux permease
MQPILGPVSDMIGKVRLMMICLVVIILASVVLRVRHQLFHCCWRARIVCGMAAGGIFPVGMALIGDMVRVEGRQVAIARWLAIVIGGNVIGGAFAGVIADLFGWRAVFLAVRRSGSPRSSMRMINLRQAVSAKPGPINLRSIPSSFGRSSPTPQRQILLSGRLPGRRSGVRTVSPSSRCCC